MIIASWAPRAGGSLAFRWDGAVYYALGTSLAEGMGYIGPLASQPGSRS